MIKRQLVISASIVCSMAAHAEIFISEYVEGSGYNKAIEIFVA